MVNHEFVVRLPVVQLDFHIFIFAALNDHGLWFVLLANLYFGQHLVLIH